MGLSGHGWDGRQMSEISDHEKSILSERDLAKAQRMRYVPPFPATSGYHWIRRYRGGPAIPLYWNALWHQNGEGWGRWAEPDREDQWEYCGPCPSPDDGKIRPKLSIELPRFDGHASGK